MEGSRRTVNEWVADYGGVLLVVAGVALIVLAAVYSARPAVAPIFAFTGIASIIFGVLLPRIEGQAEFSVRGIKFILGATRESLKAGRKTPEEIANLLELALDQVAALVSRSTAVGEPVSPPATAGAEPVSPATPPVEVPAGGEGVLSPQARGAQLEAQVREWLEQNGWEVERTESEAGGWDFVGIRGDEKVMVQVTARSHVGAADVAAIATLLPYFALDMPRAVLVVPRESMTSFAIEQARAVGEVLSVYLVQDGRFEPLALDPIGRLNEGR